MEIIRFVLSNFWVWLGAVILILAIGQEAVEIIKAVHPSRKISAYKIGDRWRMEIDGARRGDIAAAIRGIRDDENSTSGTGAGV